MPSEVARLGSSNMNDEFLKSMKDGLNNL